MKNLIPAIGLATVGTVAFCAIMAGSDDPAPQPAISAQHSNGAVVSMRTPVLTSIDAEPPVVEMPLHGVANPSQLAQLSPLVIGTIAEVHVQEGQFVRQGQLLLSLDDSVPRARMEAARIEAESEGALRQAQLELAAAERQLNRLLEADRFGAVGAFELVEQEQAVELSEAQLIQAGDRKAIAQAQQQQLMAQLQEYKIVAPFDGQIAEIHQRSGTVDPNSTLVTIANLHRLEVELHVPIAQMHGLAAGREVQLAAAQPVNSTLRGQVKSVSPMIDFASETVRCLIEIPNHEHDLPSGFAVLLEDSGVQAMTDQIAVRQTPGEDAAR